MMIRNLNPSYKIQMTEVILFATGILALLTVYQFKLDFIVADFIYEKIEWSLKTSFIFEGLLHKFSRYVLIAVYLGIIYKLIRKAMKAEDTQGIYNLYILILAIGSSVLIISVTKRFLDVDCPWNLTRYGGVKPFFSIFEYSSEYLPSAHCFPASHVSVGYSWMAVYFYFKVTNNKLKHKALGLALFLGVVFGITQQLRGAHFISHDIWSFLICLINPMIIYSMAYRSKTSEVFSEELSKA